MPKFLFFSILPPEILFYNFEYIYICILDFPNLSGKNGEFTQLVGSLLESSRLIVFSGSILLCLEVTTCIEPSPISPSNYTLSKWSSSDDAILVWTSFIIESLGSLSLEVSNLVGLRSSHF